MLVQNVKVRAISILILVVLLLTTTGLYFGHLRGRREYAHIEEIPTTCILQLGVDEFTETYWIAESETKIATESVSIFTQDGEGIWGSRHIAALSDDGIVSARETGLDHDVAFSSVKTEHRMSCSGSYGDSDFNGTSQASDVASEGFIGAHNTHNCYASFPCKHRRTHCHDHPEALGCPESGKMTMEYEHGECILYLREYFNQTEDQPKRTLDVWINDPTGLDLAVDNIGLTPNSNTTIQKRLEHPLMMHIGKKPDGAMEFTYNEDVFTKNGAKSNDRCKVGDRDDGTKTRDSTCTFQC